MNATFCNSGFLSHLVLYWRHLAEGYMELKGNYVYFIFKMKCHVKKL